MTNSIANKNAISKFETDTSINFVQFFLIFKIDQTFLNYYFVNIRKKMRFENVHKKAFSKKACHDDTFEAKM